MNKEKLFIAKDENGVEHEYEMLLVKRVDDNSVVWYTDGTYDDEGRKNVYISEYERLGNTFMLNPVGNDDKLEKYADMFTKEYNEE